jgi:hypothetical protein
MNDDVILGEAMRNVETWGWFAALFLIAMMIAFFSYRRTG